MALRTQTAREGCLIRDNEVEIGDLQEVLQIDSVLKDLDLSFLEVSAYDLLLEANIRHWQTSMQIRQTLTILRLLIANIDMVAV